MKQHFYSHIIEIDSVYTALDLLDMSVEERTELIQIVDSSVHHAVLDAVLSELSEADKKVFLAHYASENHDAVWKLLNEKVNNAEKKIRKVVDRLKKDLHEDIKKTKNKVRK